MNKRAASKNAQEITQSEILTEFFQRNPNRDIPHPEAVDWATKEYRKKTGKVFRDPDRQIRKMHQEGFLIKVKKGVYKYDPRAVSQKDLQDFSPALKKQIFERDEYKCVVCGRGLKEGMEIHADHIKAKDLGGRATLENGQTLCSQHNFLKKNFKQTETGKKLFIRLYELAKSQGDQNLLGFCTEILEVFEKNGINGHIEWKR